MHAQWTWFYDESNDQVQYRLDSGVTCYVPSDGRIHMWSEKNYCQAWSAPSDTISCVLVSTLSLTENVVAILPTAPLSLWAPHN